MMSEVIEIDEYEPDWTSSCDCCGQSPTVTGVKDGEVVIDTEMCGVCTWGEAACIDPNNW